jgi:hypothetical protein
MEYEEAFYLFHPNAYAEDEVTPERVSQRILRFLKAFVPSGSSTQASLGPTTRKR